MTSTGSRKVGTGFVISSQIPLQIQAALFLRVLLRSLPRGSAASDLTTALPAQALLSTEVPGSCGYRGLFPLVPAAVQIPWQQSRTFWEEWRQQAISSPQPCPDSIWSRSWSDEIRRTSVHCAASLRSGQPLSLFTVSCWWPSGHSWIGTSCFHFLKGSENATNTEYWLSSFVLSATDLP